MQRDLDQMIGLLASSGEQGEELKMAVETWKSELGSMRGTQKGLNIHMNTFIQLLQICVDQLKCLFIYLFCAEYLERV